MENQQTSRDYIIEAFFILLKNNKIDDISIAQICDKAGVSRVTFYRNFKDKKEIIEGYFTSSIQKFIKEMGLRHRTNNYYDIAYQTFYFLKQEKENIKAIYNNNLSYMYLDLLNNNLVKNFINDGYGTKLNAYIYSGALYNISMYWVIEDDCKQDIDSLIEAFFKICNFEIKK